MPSLMISCHFILLCANIVNKMCAYHKQVGQGYFLFLTSLFNPHLSLPLPPFPLSFSPPPSFPHLLSLSPLLLLQLAGIVYMSPRVAEIMLGLHTLPPLDACTYVGLDNGAQPLSVSENIQFLKQASFYFSLLAPPCVQQPFYTPQSFIR